MGVCEGTQKEGREAFADYRRDIDLAVVVANRLIA